MPVIAGWVSDAWDSVTDVATSVADRAAGAFEAIPGSGWVVDLVKTATGPAGDFARSEVGQVVLRAIATTLTGGLAPVLGPQLATVAWAVPGLAKGDSFTESWLNEFQWRVEKTAEIAGADLGKLVGEQLTRVLGNEAFRQAVAAGEQLSELARKFGVREDVAAMASDAVRATAEQYRRELFPDYATGKRVALAQRMSASSLLSQRTSVARYLRPVSAASSKALASMSVSQFLPRAAPVPPARPAPLPSAPVQAAPVVRAPAPEPDHTPMLVAGVLGAVAVVGGLAVARSRRWI